jgi:hypothetical protein
MAGKGFLNKPISIAGLSKLPKKQRKALIGLLIILLSLPLAIWLVKQTQIFKPRAYGPASPPQNVTFSNLHGHGLSLSWTTSVPTTGSVRYGTSSGADQNEALDDQGDLFSTATDPAYYSTTHHVTILTLNPQTTYYFKIRSGTTIYGVEVGSNEAGPWVPQGVSVSKATLAEANLPSCSDLDGDNIISGTEEYGCPYPVYGNVYTTSDKSTKAAGAITYLVANNGGQTSGVLSAIVLDNTQGWVIDLKNARHANGSLFYPQAVIGTLDINVQGGSNGVASLTGVPIPVDAPVADIVLAAPVTPPVLTPTPTTGFPTPTSPPGPTVTPTPTSVQPSPTPGLPINCDINGDGCIDGVEYSGVISYWRWGCTPEHPELPINCDINGDGCIDGVEYSGVISYWRAGCPQ